MYINSLWSQERSVVVVAMPWMGSISNFSIRFQYDIDLDGKFLWFTLACESQMDKKGNPYLRISICPESEMSSEQAKSFYGDLHADILVQWDLLLPALDEKAECHQELEKSNISIDFSPDKGLEVKKYDISDKKSQEVFLKIQRIFSEFMEY